MHFRILPIEKESLYKHQKIQKKQKDITSIQNRDKKRNNKNKKKMYKSDFNKPKDQIAAKSERKRKNKKNIYNAQKKNSKI